MEFGVAAGAVLIGFVHGVLPDHGWPIAATYALNRSNRWVYGTAAGLILGVGHLISSVALVLAYFWFSSFAAFAEGPWLRYGAGVLLILLGVREYRHGGHGHLHEHEGGHGHEGGREDPNGHGHGGDDAHGHRHDGTREHAHNGTHEHAHDGTHEHAHDGTHEHGREHGHGHDRHDHDHDHEGGVLGRVRSFLPGGGGHRHLDESHADRGLYALGTTALLLGFAHEEPVQILALCVGSIYCLELMLLYSLAVIVAIVAPTLLLIAGYEHHRETVERYTPYLPAVTAVVLVGMGLAFLTGLL